jgi:hypothetical protein
MNTLSYASSVCVGCIHAPLVAFVANVVCHEVRHAVHKCTLQGFSLVTIKGVR